ncbi:Ig-like domain-containing protein (plasmid) [Latilactobacillus curvatus]|uniref:Ig-like domain-containing protein n=1 Tax=Latilactobacillus curvatus TaxID=28038 RepID=UPI0024BBD97D|nr:Ig-like domain-containing protein [Latilactobacillus curvatus]WHQ77622.1 Ig-like domain-containing protein [Latilactobacillus curvatus]WHQ78864.1 Ig-like domain-containing protein [Latilactobacillus curvatus]WHQ79283.1 Ig-like domain-containing protein [Latilactobacillus curvatus]
MNQKTATMKVGETKQLTATVAPEDATNILVEWESSDPAVATVDQNGLVTIVKDGTADITVTTDDGGFAAKCTITATAS